MKNKSIFFVKLFIYLAIFLLFFGSSIFNYFTEQGWNPFDYARITDVDYKAVVIDQPAGNGKVIITERLTFDIHSAFRNNPFWELWRDLPEDYVDGLKVDYKVNSVKQILEDGTEIVYEESPKLYWDYSDYLPNSFRYGPGKWYHSKGPYNEDYERYECIFFYVNGIYREKMVFEIEYEMNNAALRYNDCSDLYLALFSGPSTKHLKSYRAQILVPDNDMPAPGNYEVYTYGTNSHSFPVSESATLNPGYYTFYFELDEDQLKFKPYNEYIEFDLVSYNQDKHIFTYYANENYYSHDNVLEEIRDEQQEYATLPYKYQMPKVIVFLLALGIGIYVLFYSYKLDSRMRSKHLIYDPYMDLQYFRDIPSDLDPNFANTLVFCKHKPSKDDSGVYSAILLSLARKGYIKIIETGFSDILINIVDFAKPSKLNSQPESTSLFNAAMETDFTSDLSSDLTDFAEPAPEPPAFTLEKLTPCEEHYYNLLVRHATGNTISMETFRDRVASDYLNTQSFVNNMENSVVNIGIREGYFQKADYTQLTKQVKSTAYTLIVFGVLSTVLANIISYHTRLDFAYGAFFILGLCLLIGGFYQKKNAGKYVLLTQYGTDEYEKWRGLYDFLNSETLINEREVIELALWEKFLIYATAFGISEKVINAISIRCPEVSESPILSNNYYRSHNFHHSSGRSFRSAVRSSSYSSYGGGGGGGFGYGGGGRGGGGGGGGH